MNLRDRKITNIDNHFINILTSYFLLEILRMNMCPLRLSYIDGNAVTQKVKEDKIQSHLNNKHLGLTVFSVSIILT